MLIGLFSELAKQPHHMDIIHREVSKADVTDARQLGQLKHLNAVINEALRLYPGLPTAGARKTTEKGVAVGGRFIPPHTTIITPRFVISRSKSPIFLMKDISTLLTMTLGEDCFEKATEFIPERWTTRPEMVRNSAGYTPFGTGMYTSLWLSPLFTHS